MEKFQQTREVIHYAQKYIRGRTLDLGAGKAKYREIIEHKASEYITFDCIPGEKIDVVGDILHIPFGDNSFDSVVCTQVFEHIEKPWVATREINRLLKPGGVCIVTVPFLIPFHADPNDCFRYTKEGLKSLFKNEGFKIIECDYYGRVFTVVLEMIHFIFFNPYKKSQGIWVSRFLRCLTKLAKFLDKFVKTDIVYANVYLIAQK